MVSGKILTPKSKDGINPIATTGPSTGGSGGNFTPSPDVPSLPFPAPKIMSSRHKYSKNFHETIIPEHPATRGVMSNADRHNPINENDIIIAVMGPTGAGKSSFVNSAAGKTEVAIGYDLKSQTRGVQPVRCLHPDGHRNIILVDTPGFDDTYLSDVQILRIIANWLKETYQNNIKLAGILYLHRISDVRLAGTPLRNLGVFKDVCGESNLKNIVLVTTMWDEVEDQIVGSKSEEELRSKYWKDMLHLGSRTCRFQGTRRSAWEIIDHLDLEIPQQSRIPLQIQREMVDRHLPLHETTAARTLLRFLTEEFKKIWTRMRNGVRGTVGSRRLLEGHRQHPFSRSSTIRSASTRSVTPTSVSSNYSSPEPSPAESNSSGCSTNGHQQTLLATITGLRLSYQMADIASVPVLRKVIGTVLDIAQMIERMGGTHHAISQVVEYSGWLLEEIVQYIEGYKLTKDMKRVLKSFQRELKDLQNVMKHISTRSYDARFFLYDVDIQAATACTTTIRAIYDKLEMRLAVDNRQAIARLENELTALYDSRALRQCECGKLVIQEESQGNARPSTSQSS